MATLKVFISSTCYDLGVVRSKLQEFFRSLGSDPVLSEYSDVLFDPRTHTHTSCVDEVMHCDVLVLLIGARFGGKAVPEALSRVDISKLKVSSSSTWSLEDGRSLSITQLEVLRAIELELPVFTFVDERVMHDHFVYEKNKSKPILSEITFPSIERGETALYIFEFINFLRHRATGNALTTFSRIDEIELHLRRQWSALFQRLLREDRTRRADGERARQIQQQLDDLKTAILSSIQAPEAREIARGVIRFRMLIDFAAGLPLRDRRAIILANDLTWEGLMAAAGIVRLARIDDRGANGLFRRLFLLSPDGSFLATRGQLVQLREFARDVSDFSALQRDIREAILDAWTESSITSRFTIGQGKGAFEEFVASLSTPIVVEYFAADTLERQETREFNQAATKAPAESSRDDEDISF